MSGSRVSPDGPSTVPGTYPERFCFSSATCRYLSALIGSGRVPARAMEQGYIPERYVANHTGPVDAPTYQTIVGRYDQAAREARERYIHATTTRHPTTRHESGNSSAAPGLTPTR